MRRADRKLDVVLAGACVAVFCLLHLNHASAHGIHPDAADLLYPVLGLLRREPALLAGCVAVPFAGARVPVWFHPYHGPYEGYLSLPFMAVFGNTAAAAYYRSTLFGALAVAGVYAVALRLHRSRAAAALAALLWAGSSGFILASRFGVNAGTCVVPMTLFSLWFFLGWLERARGRDLLAASALLGLACATRAWCVGILPAAALVGVFLRGPLMKAWRASGGGPRLALSCLAAFGAWFLPLALGNLLGDWQSVRFLSGAYRQGHGSPSAALWTRALPEAADGLRTALDGTRWIGLFVEDAELPAGTPMVWLAAGGALAALAAAALGRRAARRTLAGLALFTSLFAFSLLSPTNHAPNHLYPLLPLLYIGFAAAPLLVEGRRPRLAAWTAAAGLSAWALAGDARLLRWFWTEVERTGGRGAETSLAVEDLARWLTRTDAGAPAVASAVNFSGSLLYLTAGRVVPASPYWGPDPAAPADPEWWRGVLRRPGALLLFDLDPDNRRPTLDYMKAAARRERRRLERTAVFLRRDGRTVIEAYVVRPA